jgi:hypothetical protein
MTTPFNNPSSNSSELVSLRPPFFALDKEVQTASVMMASSGFFCRKAEDVAVVLRQGENLKPQPGLS